LVNFKIPYSYYLKNRRISQFIIRIFIRKHHGIKDKATVSSSEGSFTDKIFQLTNELIPSVQRSRINLHRGDSSQESIRALNERRSVLFLEWGKFHPFFFIILFSSFLFHYLIFILSFSLFSLIFFFLGAKDKYAKKISQELSDEENSSAQLNSLSSADEEYMKNNNLF